MKLLPFLMIIGQWVLLIISLRTDSLSLGVVSIALGLGGILLLRLRGWFTRRQ
jgi:hypothetical protein